MFTDSSGGGGPGELWIDTVGWEDATFDDGDTFRDIVGFLKSNGVTHIKAIIWCVIPNVRRDAALARQVKK